ncbi:MAG TPA: ABC transporter ATP-binding protein [Lachnospiraceae bacterium]|nr:ABC transporter ATP-binding protein [Lachnospiraceae bacterium]
MKYKKSVSGMILRVMRKHLLLVMGIAGSVCGAILLSLVPPMILARIIDGLTTKRMAGFGWIMAYFGLLALTGLMESAREGLLIIFGQKMTHTLRSGLMEKLVHLKADDLSRQEPGSVVSRFVGDVDTVENLFTSGIVSMFADVCRIVSILVVIWFKNRGLSMILLILLPFLLVFTRYVQKNMLISQLQNRKAVSRASGHVPETLRNIRTIHCLSKESYMERKYDEYLGDSYRAMERTNFYDAVYSPVVLILNAIVVACVMLLSASGSPRVLTLFGMSAGTAVAVMNYISQIFTPVESLGMEIQTIQSAVAGIRRINEFLSIEELPEREELLEREEFSKKEQIPEGNRFPEQRKENGEAFVEFRNVTFGYDERKILKQLSFQVKQGERVTLMGRTGAGKSTILKLLLGLYEPQEGEVRIQGIAASNIPDGDKRRIFGYVEQSFHMVPGSVKDQITLFDPVITDQAVKNVASLTGLQDTIEALPDGYDTICTPELFSQGQWQLLSIARAAVASPRLLLLDEITANLDAETEKEVLQALKRVSGERTVISISHRTSAEMGRVIPIG